jgi:hypothetical protein
VRLTGQVVIDDEQFVTLKKGMLPNLAGTVLAVLFILCLALRSAHKPRRVCRLVRRLCRDCSRGPADG